MVSVTERKKGNMDSSSEHRERIAAAVQLDLLFSAYEIEMTPSEAFTFAEAAPPAGVTKLASLRSLIEQINAAVPAVDFGPGHPQTGRPHHSYRIGRDRGFRLIKLEIFKGFFHAEYDFMGLMKTVYALGTEAGAQVLIDTDNNSYSIDMHWGGSDQ